MKNTFTQTKSEGNHAVSIAFVHHKGGTGKTTSCLNVAGWLAKMDKRVLVIDLDPQGNATAGLCVDRKTVQGSIYDVLLGLKPVQDVILETDADICLIPSSLDLLAAEKLMSHQMNNAYILKQNLGDRKMDLDIDAQGDGIEMRFDPAMMAEFQRGDFSGVVGVILQIVPIPSPLP